MTLEIIPSNPPASKSISAKPATCTQLAKAADCHAEAHLPPQGPVPHPELADVIYLGIDTHARLQVVSRQIDHTTPQPAQKFNNDGFLIWAAKQQTLAKRVVCCYEAGCTGYVLYRKLRSMGIECHVVQAQDWNDNGRCVKTDGRDARALCDALVRYDRGNTKALGIVRVPTEKEERARGLVRQRCTLKQELQRIAAIGRSLGLNYGYAVESKWWKERAWKRLCSKLPDWFIELLTPHQKVLTILDQEHEGVQHRIEAQAGAATARPKGLGAQSEVELLGEVCDWNRFNNRRQVGAYTGLCPREYSSGGKRRQGSVNKHGNPALRKVLVETTWRFLRFQKDWGRLKAFKEAQGNPTKLKITKKNVVGLARGLAIDLWRLFTGKATLEDLGLKP
jgi:transposase